MKHPCTVCKFEVKRTEGHRTFVGCSDKEKEKKGFKYDDFMYNHKCSEQEIKEKCKKCIHLIGIYCDNVYSECKFEEK
jgi:hypothetical protein